MILWVLCFLLVERDFCCWKTHTKTVKNPSIIVFWFCTRSSNRWGGPFRFAIYGSVQSEIFIENRTFFENFTFFMFLSYFIPNLWKFHCATPSTPRARQNRDFFLTISGNPYTNFLTFLSSKPTKMVFYCFLNRYLRWFFK